MSEKLSERTLPILVLPAGRYGMLGGGGTGLLNGLAHPGTTGVAGETGSLGNVTPLGGPIDTQGFNRALVLVNTKGQTGTAQTITTTAYHGPLPWYSATGTTAVAGFTFDLAGALPMQGKGEIRTENLQRYLWISQSFAGPGESQASTQVILGEPDKSVSGNTLLDDA